MWVAKLVLGGRRFEERRAQADDAGAEPGALPYPTAETAAIEWKARLEQAEGADTDVAAVQVPTVRSAVEAYVAARASRTATAGRDAESRLSKHVFSDADFADMPMARLTASAIQAWRRRLSKGLAPTTVTASSTISGRH
ncbi:hypothetical protein [Methylobacterium oxalidis]|uniref:Core-binding (CB) domain-containing protein n=1 Tax=Methylobacterium oxalidis TaxID=944322 RepID=A0A512J9A4_9HYPH|nr:hypothetical protein [Methylobacterium oxalidis]GEP06523.1 hypothetical protein MOX02_45610 [Methylobacterium oxalidis]GLS63899.1 hypothetical protein GCM10007888_22800 [Methylobacterium oxalidis]